VVRAALGQAEVGGCRPAALVEHDVRRLDIAVDDPGRVEGVEAGPDLRSDLDAILHRQPTVRREPIGERAAARIGDDQVVVSVRVPRLEDRHQVSVPHLLCYPGLAAKAPGVCLVLREVALQHLDRDVSPVRPLGAKDDADRSFAENRLEAVRAEHLAELELGHPG